MPHPFDDPDATFIVLVNDEGQHSIWPSFIDEPEGWRAVHGESDLHDCLDFVDKSWTDLRPLSLVRAMVSG